ncbi:MULTISPECIES: hypothetical protein [unclassified Luteibacter]|uniref:hypothetical protein n=1 Tax=unclassified Luteibacter TaxID=2620188 RepID=UPI0008D4C36A|nr:MULTISPECIES: hypothetical protein [unclassified Luteibacter]MDR6936094.1 hypothetical protein [Luteibacter sp. 3190]SEO55132.1 hypothetical protein SAMN02800692_1098 [Luteibacter sp. UNC138MFCol5.1]SEV88762.1 hypothetical protein SAMN04515660_0662 [Luteibacter sp. 329MFSha]
MAHRKIGYFDVEGTCYVAKPGRWRGKYVISEDGEEVAEHLCKTLHEDEEQACQEGLTLGITAARQLMKEREGFDPGEE